MRKTLTILASSFRLTMQELMVNKLRTSLSLIGISFGIFCIIGVLATVNSLGVNIQKQINSLGTNTIYLDKWSYFSGNGPDYPWWKYVNRPAPKFSEVNLIKQRSQLASHVAFLINSNVDVVYKNYSLQGVAMYGESEEANEIQPITMAYGRFISGSEFISGSPVIVMGYDNAENLFGSADQALGKEVSVKNHNATIIGVIKKMGQTFGWDYDNGIFAPYRFARQVINEDNSNPKIIVDAKSNISSAALADDLEGVMRSIRKLSPKQEDNFTLNQINGLSAQAESVIGNINLGGWAIGILSLVVGAFGIANIMFVTVKERTPMIGLKKAIGAKKRSILSEFLLESAIICILGGIIGLILVYLLTVLLTSLFNFPVYISAGILSLAISICVIIGVLAGFIPALTAARLDPVVAIRS